MIVSPWPDRRELDKIEKKLAGAHSALDELCSGLGALIEEGCTPPLRKGVPVPTLEEFGALSVFLATAKFDLELLDGTLAKLSEIRDEVGCFEPVGEVAS